MFENAANNQALATEQGDYKVANNNYDIIVTVTEFLKENNSIDNLLNFLNHPSVGVRIWAASYLLPKHEKEGLKVLEEIAKSSGIHAFDAETTINEFKKGNLKF